MGRQTMPQSNLHRPGRRLFTLLALGILLAFAAVLTPRPVQAQGALYLTAIDRLSHWGIISAGPGEGRFIDRLTRGELAKLAAAAAGREAEALTRTGELPFADLAGHWAAGYVAVAREAGLLSGYPDGTFRPNEEVTYAQLLAVLLRLVGHAPGPEAPWPEGYVDAAIAVGIVPAELPVDEYATVSAVRGPAFVLADTAFVRVLDANGQNLYQRVFAAPPPRVLISPGVARETTGESFSLSGVVENARAVFLNGEPLPLDSRAIFSLQLSLQLGENRFFLTAEGWEGTLDTVEWVVVRH